MLIKRWSPSRSLCQSYSHFGHSAIYILMKAWFRLPAVSYLLSAFCFITPSLTSLVKRLHRCRFQLFQW